MARRTPPRDSKGRFVSRKRSTRKRSRRKARRNLPPRDSNGRFVSTRRRSRSRRSYRRNPATPDIFGLLMDGTIEAGQVLVGKAAARSVPDLAGLPKQGNVGLATQMGVALGMGWLADMFWSKQAARAILAGGLTAPLETLVVAYNVPWLSTALSPTTANATVSAYSMPRRALPGGVASYARPSGGMRGYVPRTSGRGSRQAASSGAMGWY